MGLTQHDLGSLDDQTCILLLGTYIMAVQQGDNKMKLLNMSAQSITNYLQAAHSWLEVHQGRHIDILDPNASSKSSKYHPFLGQQIADCRAWYKPSKKKEPYTAEMFEALAKALAAQADPLRTFVDKVYAVYDWCRLGVFTGFRITEYAQSRLKKGQKFLLVPSAPFVPQEWWGTPLAFIAADFTFYDKTHRVVTHDQLFERFQGGDVIDLEIRWRYDKSAHNFSIRRFRTTGHPIFDPVGAAVSIIHRHNLLGVEKHLPLGVFRTATGKTYRFLKDTDVKQVMQGSVDLAYPDKAHYMQKNKKLVLPHSNRVTAAVCLQRGGANNDEIAFKLRWHPSSVPTYLRDCFESVGDMLQRAVTGVLKLTFA